MTFYSIFDFILDKAGTVTRTKKVTILADYNFYLTWKVDNLFQFIDCVAVDAKQLTKDV